MESMMILRVNVKPKVLVWARESAALSVEQLVAKFPKYKDWENGKTQPTLKQLENFAKYIHVPCGYFYLSEPPDESLQLPDLRIASGEAVQRPSINLRSTIYDCELRQDWYQNLVSIEEIDPFPFAGTASTDDCADAVASVIRRSLALDHENHNDIFNWAFALHDVIERAEALGVMVMVSSVVRHNTHRRLELEEFRGFALSDELAPLIFINGAATKAEQMFTMAHLLALVWLGKSGLSNSSPSVFPENKIDAWCNKVAAETLVPLNALRGEYRTDEALHKALARLTRRFNVSELVMLRRIYDLRVLTQKQFQEAYEYQLSRPRRKISGNGGSFPSKIATRVGKRFAYALINDTLGTQTLYRDAFRLLGIQKTSTFCKLARHLGIEQNLPPC